MKTKPDITSTIDAQSPCSATNSSGKAPLASLQREFNSFIADIDSLAQQNMLLAGEDLSGIRERLTQRVKQAKVSAEESAEAAADSLQQYASNAIVGASHYVRDRPWQTLGIGTAIGVALGLVLMYRQSTPVKI